MLIRFQLCAPLRSAILSGHFMHTFKSRFISWGVTLFARVKGHAFSSSVIGYFFVVPLTRIVPVFFFSVPKISNISRKLSQVSRFPAKSPDSRKNFVFLPKQTLLGLSPPVILGRQGLHYIFSPSLRTVFVEILKIRPETILTKHG